MKTVKVFYMASGVFFLGLGIVGIILPLVPTAPFLLLACFCFSKGSGRFYKWLSSNKIYKRYVGDFEKTRSMTIRAKMAICLMASAFVAIPVIFIPFIAVRIMVLCILLFKWYYFIFVIKTKEHIEAK